MNEHEAFEKWYSSMWVERLDRNKHGQYKSVKVRSSWFAWQASASREGYKLVPVCKYCNGYGEVGCQFEGTFTCPECNGDRIDLKAMIGAVDEI